MGEDNLVKQTIMSTAIFAVFITAFVAGMDLVQGTSPSLVGILVSSSIGAAVYAAIFYALLRRRGAANAA
jgi:hypothetical protein